MDKNAFKSSFLWGASRAGLFYVLVFGLLALVVNWDTISDKVKKGRLNYFYPDFAAFSNREIKGEGEIKWAPYQRYFRLVLGYIPNEPGAELGLAYIDIQQGKLKEAQEALIKSLQRQPMLFWNLYNLGILAYQRGEGALAERFLSVCLVIPPEYVVRSMLSSIVYRQILFGADKTYNTEQSVLKAREEVATLLLAHYVQAKLPDRALALAKQMLEKGGLLRPAPILFYAGRAAFDLGNMGAAEEFFTKEIATGAHNPVTYGYLAKIADQSGQVDVAAKYRQQEQSSQGSQANQYFYDQGARPRFF